MSRAALRRDERGMTLLELMLSLVIASLLVGTALTFLKQQGQAFSFGTGRMSVLQTHRFVLDVLERDLRTAGSGVPAQQPFLVYADSQVVAFNADHTSRDTADVFAVYIDPDAPANAVQALTRSRRFQIPGTGFTYPDTSYSERNTNSPAETIVFFFDRDTTTARTDDWVLYRQVNDLAPAVVGRNLLRSSGRPFFQYSQLVESDTAASRIDPVPVPWLPLAHSVRAHRSPADTGRASRIDRVRGVRVNFVASNGETGPREQQRAVTRLIRLPNAGMARLQTCGEAPQLGTSLVAAGAVLASGERVVQLAWGQAGDENSGERDVVRYVLWRRTTAGGEWGDPYLSIPAGQTTYSYADGDVTPGVTYYYALAAQDCTPSISALSTTGGIAP